MSCSGLDWFVSALEFSPGENTCKSFGLLKNEIGRITCSPTVVRYLSSLPGCFR